MLHICLAIVSLIGLIMNGYILVVVLLTKQVRTFGMRDMGICAMVQHGKRKSVGRSKRTMRFKRDK